MPPPRTETLRTLMRRRWEELNKDSPSLTVPPLDTVRPPRRDRDDEAALGALLNAGQDRGPGARVQMREVLGVGGMGVVHLGTQASLDRDVAVKIVRPDKRSSGATVKLLQEAWIGGALQHPNIVPIYDVGVGEAGEALIVQQRVQGLPWSELLDDEQLVRDRFQISDPLQWHLRVLIQVCDAVRFAHAHGILHLDIKPSNVMVGSFGEVFLLDWGLAMAIHDDGTGRLPVASEIQDVIGTPAFMAPEMLSQGEEPLTTGTDVYLLGATLYRICAGVPPHRGPTTLATLFAVATKEPERLTGVPDELADLCARAMATDAEARFGGAGQLRVALQAFLEHRGAIRLAEQAIAKEVELEARWAADDPDDRAIEALFTEARFGMEQAQAAWPQGPIAGDGIVRLHLGMARWELTQDRPQAAHALLARLEDPPQDLVAEVRQRMGGLRDLGVRVQKLQALADQRDLSLGRATRVLITAGLGLLFTLLPLLRIAYSPPERLDWPFIIGTPLVLLGVLGPLALWKRRSLKRSAVTRSTMGTIVVLLIGQALLAGSALELGLHAAGVMPLLMVWWAGTAAMYSVHVDRRLLPTCLSWTLALLATLRWPEAQWWFSAMGNLIFTINVSVVWWPDRKPRAGRPLAEEGDLGERPG